MSAVPQAACGAPREPHTRPSTPLSVCVFDLGGVLLDWQPELLVARLCAPEERALVLQQVLTHTDWLRLDRGTLTVSAAIDAASARTGLPRERIATLFEEVPAALAPKPSSVALLERVCARGHDAYCLSNMPRYALARIRTHSFWGLFTGAVISSRCGMVKPEQRIYRWLLQTHGIDPARAFFVDDRAENIAAARAVGIAGHTFEDAGRCEAALADAGLL